MDPRFCLSLQVIDERLPQVGAERFHVTAFADNGTGLEQEVEPWKEGLFMKLEKIQAGSDHCAAARRSTVECCHVHCTKIHPTSACMVITFLLLVVLLPHGVLFWPLTIPIKIVHWALLGT
uniref:Uncharacterized protein n=1 Tax=Eutreptiella gymnastica TaxID=73025 RepID=A0A7S1IFB0_9EUGL|mmetsp:Transcript_152984/g.267359  ORF Transcript_152984/g.267359 Transcript_152984/m.267359 type:complete len:121 (+) Transcript_152984:36-398(+)